MWSGVIIKLNIFSILWARRREPFLLAMCRSVIVFKDFILKNYFYILWDTGINSLFLGVESSRALYTWFKDRTTNCPTLFQKPLYKSVVNPSLPGLLVFANFFFTTAVDSLEDISPF